MATHETEVLGRLLKSIYTSFDNTNYINTHSTMPNYAAFPATRPALLTGVAVGHKFYQDSLLWDLFENVDLYLQGTVNGTTQAAYDKVAAHPVRYSAHYCRLQSKYGTASGGNGGWNDGRGQLV